MTFMSNNDKIVKKTTTICERPQTNQYRMAKKKQKMPQSRNKCPKECENVRKMQKFLQKKEDNKYDVKMNGTKENRKHTLLNDWKLIENLLDLIK